MVRTVGESVRVTGKLLRNTKTGQQFACREVSNVDYRDDSVKLIGIDVEYYYPLSYVQSLVGPDGNLEVVRDLYNKEYPFTKRQVVSARVKR